MRLLPLLVIVDHATPGVVVGGDAEGTADRLLYTGGLGPERLAVRPG